MLINTIKRISWWKCFIYTAQKMKFFIKDFSSKCDQIRSKLHLLCSVSALMFTYSMAQSTAINMSISLTRFSYIGVKVFRYGPSKICGRQQTISFKFSKGCLPQILFGTFLNTLTHICLPIFKIFPKTDSEL